MNYYIDIIDTEEVKSLTFEDARANSIILSWNGSDVKDEVFIVGSSLSFDLAAPNTSMGHFIHLFTANETRYRVELRALDDERLLWQGFLLPDSYEEPYTNNVPFVKLVASDGLGRLKGKYLPDAYYTKEVSVIDVIQTCLAQTGLDLDLYFSPAIIHVSNQKYHEIYIDGGLLYSSDKKQTCYVILTNLLESMVCCLFQSLGNWYVEGLNVRHLTTVVYDRYVAGTGAYGGEVEVGRKLKIVEGQAFEAPNVTMVPVYKSIRVEYDIEQPKLPDNLTQEKNDGWSASVHDYIYADAFFPHGGDSFAMASLFSEYKVKFHKNYGTDDPSRYMSLREPVYVDVGQEVSVEIDFNYSILTSIINDKTSLKIQIILNGVVLYESSLYNNPYLEDEDEQTLTALKEAFLISESGYFDVFIFRPISDGTSRLERDGWELKTFKVTVVNQDETFLIEDVLNEDYSIEKEIDLVYADEFSGLNPSFLLAKLKEVASETYQYDITVFNEFVSKGFTYLQVSLRDANLCDTFKDSLYVNAVNVPVLEVIYNWLGSTSEYMLKIATPTDGNPVQLLIVKQFSGAFDRSTWQSWTDAVYKVESERYGKIVSNIYRRMFLVPYEKIDLTVKKMVSFNDLLLFKYIDLRRYVPINLTVDLDSGESTVTQVLNYYQDNDSGTSDNIPPILTIMDNVCIDADAKYVDLTSSAYDPDGFIVSHVWELITPVGADYFLLYPSGSVPGNAPNVTATHLSYDIDEFIFSCTVIDNAGAEVVKTVTVCRIVSESVLVNYQCGKVSTGVVVPPYRTSTADPRIYGDQYQKGVLFLLPDTLSTDYNFLVNLRVSALICSAMTMDESLDVDCSVLYDTEDSGRGEPYVSAAGIKVFKNGLKVGAVQLFQPDNLEDGFLSFAMNSADTILIMIGGYKSGSDYVNTEVSIESMTEIDEAIEIDNTDLVFRLTDIYTLK